MNDAAQRLSIRQNIQQFGWHCLHIFPIDEGEDFFSYTIGFTETFDAPEILVFGLSRENAHPLLSECATVLRSGRRFSPGLEDDSILGNGYKVVFKPLLQRHFGEYVGTAVRYYGERPFDALVMFLPDRNSKFSWDPSYDDLRPQSPARSFSS